MVDCRIHLARAGVIVGYMSYIRSFILELSSSPMLQRPNQLSSRHLNQSNVGNVDEEALKSFKGGI